MMRKFSRFDTKQIESDFQNRVEPSLRYSMLVGNLYSASLYMALASLIDNTNYEQIKRIGLFSYGSGCSSEFFSGLVGPDSKKILAGMNIQHRLNQRYKLSIEEYERLAYLNREWGFGVMDKEMDMSHCFPVYDHFFAGKKLLVLKKIKNYHREYEWS